MDISPVDYHASQAWAAKNRAHRAELEVQALEEALEQAHADIEAWQREYAELARAQRRRPSSDRHRKERRMGAWGDGPYDNDPAADWFGANMPALADRVRATLEDPDADRDHWRAAAWVVARLGFSSYVWPVARIDHDRALARERLAQLADDDGFLRSWVNPGWVRALLRQERDAIPEPRNAD